MKYSNYQKEYLKMRDMVKLRKKHKFVPIVEVENGYYIVESKMNYVNRIV